MLCSYGQSNFILSLTHITSNDELYGQNSGFSFHFIKFSSQLSISFISIFLFFILFENKTEYVSELYILINSLISQIFEELSLITSTSQDESQLTTSETDQQISLQTEAILSFFNFITGHLSFVKCVFFFLLNFLSIEFYFVQLNLMIWSIFISFNFYFIS